jgi:amino acid transporter
MIVTLFAYNGWWYSTYVAEEVQHPESNIPRSIFFGMGIVLVLYLLANVVYLRVLPFEVLRASERPAAEVMVALLGAGGGTFIALAVMVSAFGTVNTQMLSIPRIYFAAARDGLFFGWIRRIHPRFRTPVWAIGAQALWCLLHRAIERMCLMPSDHQDVIDARASGSFHDAAQERRPVSKIREALRKTVGESGASPCCQHEQSHGMIPSALT